MYFYIMESALYATAEVLAVRLPVRISGAATPNPKPTKPFYCFVHYTSL